MKKLIKISLAIISILIVIAILWAGLVLYSFTGARPQTPNPVYSPDGSKVVIPMVNSNKDDYYSYLLVYLEIKDTQSGKILFKVQTRASDRMRWSVSWIDENTVKLDSSDIGTYCWAEGDNSTWGEAICP